MLGRCTCGPEGQAAAHWWQVRACAAATLAAMLEGAPQRAYLAIAEARPGSHQPVRCPSPS